MCLKHVSKIGGILVEEFEGTRRSTGTPNCLLSTLGWGEWKNKTNTPYTHTTLTIPAQIQATVATDQSVTYIGLVFRNSLLHTTFALALLVDLLQTSFVTCVAAYWEEKNEWAERRISGWREE